MSVCRFCLVQLDKYIYAVGGCNLEGNLSSVSRYLEDSDDWDFVCPMPVALRFVSCSSPVWLYWSLSCCFC